MYQSGFVFRTVEIEVVTVLVLNFAAVGVLTVGTATALLLTSGSENIESPKPHTLSKQSSAPKALNPKP